MTRPEHLEHLAGLQRLGLPANEDSAVRVVVRYLADRGVVCAEDEALSIVREISLETVSPSVQTTNHRGAQGAQENMTDDDADHQPETAAAGNDETTIVPPATEMAQWPAWSVEEPATVVLPRPWRSAWVIASIGLFSGVIIALAIFGVVALLKDDRTPPTGLAQVATGAPTSVITVVAASPTQPSMTVTAQPAPTVTVTPPPTTVTAQAAPPPASGGTDVFTTCPDGREGVVGGRTTCAFAANVRQTFYATGMSNHFTAFSPVTGEGYEMTCVGRYTAHFSDGSTMISTRCYGGDNAEVVIW